MKASTVFVSLLALAGTAAAAESADAAVLDVEIPNNLREAICHRDWYEAIELSSTLIASATITPDERQTLVELRRNLYGHLKDGAKPEETVSCKGIVKRPSIATQTPLYEGATPRFSNRNRSSVSVGTTSVKALYGTTLSSLWTVGTRVDGNSIRGTVLNNGLTAAKNVTLTIRSQQDDQSETIKTVAIDTVSPWSETDFVATFNHSPGNWMIESIEIN
ncbi:hypothetical protein D0962_35975 [Leptolyngbyaceae cyanobacterium CCMR0082]|uniref:Uncharacterized protein n=2 Tax=Adonisia turfae TaxID=2950184 RepID=A0A6M0SHL8_9CYAN|nr:hypothetical protein [Adonisia turfae]MDV3353072.1 hypothetical protein [Leptothoe sp. LEGE 181152]NEZ55808.1 hypothetical protein [Adonisia turfae CCMR0081]NEZ68070.1 hypothetical protein [Adonisia turfae CCMR0082]